jgi:hypothetical protein
MKYLHNENYKILKKNIEEDTGKQVHGLAELIL